MTVHMTPPANSSTADNHNNIIILTVTVIAGIVIIGVLFLITVVMSFLFLHKTCGITAGVVMFIIVMSFLVSSLAYFLIKRRLR